MAQKGINVDGGIIGEGMQAVPMTIMPLYDGQSLESILGIDKIEDMTTEDVRRQIKAPTFSDLEKLLVCEQLIEGIMDFHKHGLLHRDIKLDNLLYNRALKQLFVIDYGEGYISDGPIPDDYEKFNVKEEYFIGNIEHASPEAQQKGAKYYSAKSDNYAVGMLLVELLSNKTLEQRKKLVKEAQPDLWGMQIDQAVRQDLLSDVSQENYPIMEGLTGILSSLLESDPSKRGNLLDASLAFKIKLLETLKNNENLEISKEEQTARIDQLQESIILALRESDSLSDKPKELKEALIEHLNSHEVSGLSYEQKNKMITELKYSNIQADIQDILKQNPSLESTNPKLYQQMVEMVDLINQRRCTSENPENDIKIKSCIKHFASEFAKLDSSQQPEGANKVLEQFQELAKITLLKAFVADNEKLLQLPHYKKAFEKLTEFIHQLEAFTHQGYDNRQSRYSMHHRVLWEKLNEVENELPIIDRKVKEQLKRINKAYQLEQNFGQAPESKKRGPTIGEAFQTLRKKARSKSPTRSSEEGPEAAQSLENQEPNVQIKAKAGSTDESMRKQEAENEKGTLHRGRIKR